MEKKITINKNKCIHCGMFLKDCIVSALEFAADQIPQYGKGGKERCVGCQHCMTICPAGANLPPCSIHGDCIR